MRLDHLLSKRKEKGVVYTPEPASVSFLPLFYIGDMVSAGNRTGDIAQLARASALQAEGQGFESPYLQK